MTLSASKLQPYIVLGVNPYLLPDLKVNAEQLASHLLKTYRDSFPQYNVFVHFNKSTNKTLDIQIFNAHLNYEPVEVKKLKVYYPRLESNILKKYESAINEIMIFPSVEQSDIDSFNSSLEHLDKIIDTQTKVNETNKLRKTFNLMACVHLGDHPMITVRTFKTDLRLVCSHTVSISILNKTMDLMDEITIRAKSDAVEYVAGGYIKLDPLSNEPYLDDELITTNSDVQSFIDQQSLKLKDLDTSGTILDRQQSLWNHYLKEFKTELRNEIFKLNQIKV